MLIINSRYAILIRNILGLKQMVGYISSVVFHSVSPNGVAVFQRQMDRIIAEEQLRDTFPYLDYITVAGFTQEKHDSNVAAFLKVVSKRNLTLN